MEDEPKITTVQKVKNPKRVEQGKRLALISKEAKAWKAAERKKAEEECIKNSNLLYLTVGVLGVTCFGYGVYNFFCKKEGPQQQVEQQQPPPSQPSSKEEEKKNFDDL